MASLINTLNNELVDKSAEYEKIIKEQQEEIKRLKKQIK